MQGKEKNKHKKPHNRPYLWRSRSTTRQCSFMSLFLAGGKSLVDNTCPQNRACSTCSISQAAPDRHKHPAENRTHPPRHQHRDCWGVHLQGGSRDRHGQIHSDTGAEAASKFAQGRPSALLNRWRASCPAQHHEKQRHTRHKCLTNRAVCFQILLETRVVKCCQAIHTSRFHFVPQLQML